METMTQEPAVIDAGTTLEWDVTIEDFPAPTWSLSYRLVNRTDSFAISSTSNPEGTFSISVPATTTAGYAAGVYDLIGSVTDGTRVHIVRRRTVTVRPNALNGDPVDSRTSNERILDAVRAALEGSATTNQMQLSVGGRALQRYPLADLQRMEGLYAMRVAREKGQVSGIGASFGTRFVRPL